MMLPIFNKYLVFVDESGDHHLCPHNQEFPLFILVFCIIERTHYASFITPKFLELKLKYFQDPHVVFHEREIRKAIGQFTFLSNTALREAFFNDLNYFMQQAEYKIIVSVINKKLLQSCYNSPVNPYELSTIFCLERLQLFLQDMKEDRELTIIFEARGKKEDDELELSFRRITDRGKRYYTSFGKRFDLKILQKTSNCFGLQLSDLIARPIGRHILKPEQPNRAYEIIKNKFHSVEGKMEGYGLKIFP